MKINLKKTFLRGFSAVRQELPTFMLSTFGTTIVAFGIMSLTIPYRFPDSGVSGIAVLSSYAFGISPAWVVAILNLVLLLWGLRELPKRFIGWTIYGVILLTILLKLFESMPYPLLNERLLVAILAGTVKGLGSGLVLRSGSSLGGTDILVVALRKRYGVEVGQFTFYIKMAEDDCILLFSEPVNLIHQLKIWIYRFINKSLFSKHLICFCLFHLHFYFIICFF